MSYSLEISKLIQNPKTTVLSEKWKLNQYSIKGATSQDGYNYNSLFLSELMHVGCPIPIWVKKAITLQF